MWGGLMNHMKREEGESNQKTGEMKVGENGAREKKEEKPEARWSGTWVGVIWLQRICLDNSVHGGARRDGDDGCTFGPPLHCPIPWARHVSRDLN